MKLSRFWKIIYLAIVISCIGAFSSYADADFSVQPRSKDLGHVTVDAAQDINFTDGSIAKLTEKETVTLQYLHNNTWTNTSITVTVADDGTVSVPLIPYSSNIYNHELRLKAKKGAISNVFYVNINKSTLPTPAPLTGMSAAEQYPYTAGDDVVLVPDIEEPVSYVRTEVDWQVSYDGGTTWETVITMDTNEDPALVATIDADCCDTGALYRFAVVDPENRVFHYSDPIELIVYEKYSVTGGVLTIENAGPSGIMNSYTGRMASLVPWKTEKTTVTELDFDVSVTDTGAAAFRGFTALETIHYRSIQTIGENTFEGCTSIKTVSLPVSIRNVNAAAYKDCTGLLDVTVLNPGTFIDPATNTFPYNTPATTQPVATLANESIVNGMHTYPVIYGYMGIARDPDNAISESVPGSTAYDYAMSTNHAFFPIGAIDEDGIERRLQWDYTLGSTGNIEQIKVSAGTRSAMGHDGLIVYVPKVLDGHLVTKLVGFDMGDTGVTDIFGYTEETEPFIDFEELRIPDTVTEMGSGSFDRVIAVNHLYSFSKNSINTPTAIRNDQTIYPDAEVYTYSTNKGFRRHSDGFSKKLFDLETFTGTTGSLSYSANIESGQLYIYGTGASGSYTDAGEQPFAWADEEINTIRIGEGVTSLGNYLFGGFSNVRLISNESNDLSNVSLSAFDGVGTEVTTGSKLVKTSVNLKLYNAITALNVFSSSHALLSDTVAAKKVKLSAVQKELNDLKYQIRSAKIEGDTELEANLQEQYDTLSREVIYRDAEITAAEGSSETIQETIASKRLLLDNAKSNTITLNGQLQTETDPDAIEVILAAIQASTDLERFISNDIEELEEQLLLVPFAFSYSNTRSLIGTGIYFEYDASTLTLTIDGDGVMAPITNPVTAPWYPVSEYILKVVINKNVTSLSDNMFHGMPSLRTVWNYGKNQTFVNSSAAVFDTIYRYNTVADGNDIVTLTVPERESDTDEAKLTQRTSVLAQAHSLNIDLSENDLTGLVLNCDLQEHNHTSSCYSDGQLVCGHPNEHTHTLDDCYEQGAIPDLQGGAYTFERTSTTEEIIAIITGAEDCYTEQRYIVPVYTFGNDAASFNACVPSEADGYRLENIFLEKGICGEDLTWYISLDGCLIIEGTGDMYDYPSDNAPWKTKAAQIKAVSLPSGLTTIGSYAFSGCELLTGIDIPVSVTKINDAAFIHCTNLYSFTVGSSITKIGSGVFADCTSLRIIDTGANSKFSVENGCLIENGKKLISYCRESLYADALQKTLYEVQSDFSVPAGIEEIGPLAFFEAKDFYNLNLPASVVTIGQKAFYGLANLRNIDSMANAETSVSATAFFNCGNTFASGKTAVLFQANTSLKTAVTSAGYAVQYHDVLDIDSVSAVYTGGPVTLNRSFDKANVLITVFYHSGDTMSTNGTDERISFSSTIVKQPASKFTAVFNDGYGNVVTSNEFNVEGKNGITETIFSYTGTDIWFNENINRENVMVKLIYADGATTIIRGDAKYNSSSGQKYYVSFDSTLISKVGNNDITCTYKDAEEQTYTGVMKVRGLNYVTSMSAEYRGEAIEAAAGVSGLDYEKVGILLNYVNGNTVSTTAADSKVVVSTETVRTDTYIIFEYTLVEDNRNDLVGSFSVPYTTNIMSVDFRYTGAPVTENTAFSWSGVELTLHYADGSDQRVSGDTVTGLSASTMIVDGAGMNKTVDVTYEVGNQTFTGEIDIPCVIRRPVKLKVTRRPKKSVYRNGDYFDKTGMVITCLYDNGSSEDVTEAVTIDGGNVMTDSATYITLAYLDTSSGVRVSTNMTINVNQYQRTESMTKQFREQYAITRILFRSKKTSDEAQAYSEEDLEDVITDEHGNTGFDENGDGEISAEEMVGVWQDVTPGAGSSVFSGTRKPIIKAGYGFELKITTNYKTNRGGSEFNAFLLKAKWDTRFEADNPSLAGEISNKWAYLNDVYPQATETPNPDILYLRVINTNMIGADTVVTNLDVVGDRDEDRGFIVLEKTNVNEDGTVIDEGEWYDSTKIFEIPERDPLNSGVDHRRVYVSPGASDIETDGTEYTIQIISPAFYGYEAEPVLTGERFIYSTDPDSESGIKTWSNGEKYLIVCAAFQITVKRNNDLHTHINQ